MSAAASRRSASRSRPPEGNENELGTPVDPPPLRPPRSPLSSIQDASRNPRDGLPIEPGSAKTESNTTEPKLCPADNPSKGHGATPRLAQSALARAASRISNGNGGHTPQHTVARERGCSSRVSSAVPDAKSLVPVEVPYFELNEDPSFWKDHNVQVLMRIRPTSGVEIALQGYKRCLVQESSQTVTWTGHPETRFTFDHVACETMSQEKLFKIVGLPMVENCMSGYNSCMFAYGQTGSGKTYTMMGEIREKDNSLSQDRGMTPRIFEYLFTRIREEEEIRSGEQLKYSCKCSFLEIYNEQITDLLEPSSTNLQLREDIKKGVYVENLKEYEVLSVKDVFELLLQGAANRKMAATHMNSESSRSHSVFTCVIESQWEKDSMTHLRFGRLNLVDLAGSERQKSSGAEAERLKEAANINRSLSTLGLVIMTLVDIANGKHRHVPYRDSRLTFLLQDSLGGNSKTTIIANVSPSTCSASETLSTLKFAQRAKLIQNNAKVNEDASGDVMALQQQIQNLKDQLIFLTKHQNSPRSLCYPSDNLEQVNSGDIHNVCNSALGGNPDTLSSLSLLNQKINCLEATLTGALRRERMAEAVVRRLEAEIKHMNRLVHQREDDAHQSKAMLRFREEKLKRLELLADDLISSDGYLMEENAALSEEIQLLREIVDRNPELTQFALENMRLLEQLRMFQDFYQQGERETLLAEISHLRNQLLKIIEEKFAVANRGATQNDDHIKELGSCRRQLGACLKYNATLAREVDDLRCQLKHCEDVRQTTILNVGDASRDDHRNQETDKQSPVEPKLVEGGLDEGIGSYKQVARIPHLKTDQWMGDIVPSQFSDVQKELRDAQLLVEAMESQQAHLIEELDNLKQENCRYLELLNSKVDNRRHATQQVDLHCQMLEAHKRMLKLNNLDADEMSECGDTAKFALIATLQKMHEDLTEAKILNRQLQGDHASQLTCQREMEHFQEQVEAETAKTILYLQEELAELQQEVDLINASKISATGHSMLWRTKYEEIHNRLCFLVQENVRLSNHVIARDAEISELSDNWEKAIIELTSFLIDGWRSLEDASDCIGSVVDSFPQRNDWINEHVERAIKVFIEKEKLIANLQKRLEDAQEMGLEMKSKLHSLKGATLAITEVQQLDNDENSKELFHLREVLGEKVSRIQELENTVKCKEDAVIDAEKNAEAAFVVIKKLYAMNTAESFDVGVIKSMLNELVNEKSLVIRDCNSPRYETQILPLYAQTKDVEVNPKLELSFPVEHDSVRTQERNAEDACSLEEIRFHVEMAMQRVLESNDALCSSYADTEKYLNALISVVNSTAAEVKMLIHDLVNDFHAINKKFSGLKEKRNTAPSIMVESPPLQVHDSSKSMDHSTVMKIIIDRLAKTNAMVSGIKDGFDSLFNVYRELTEQEHEICPKMDLQIVCKNHGNDKFKQYAEDPIPNVALILCMMEESELAMNSLMEIRFQLTLLLDGTDIAGCSAQEICSDESPAIETNGMLLHTNHRHPSDPLAKVELCQMLQTLEERLKEVDVGCSKTRQILSHKLNHAMQDANEKTKLANGLFLKFGEAQETMEEAELVLNALLKANEDAKHERDWWKQASGELLAEKIALTKEVQRLEVFNFSEAKQYESLQDQSHVSLINIIGLISSLQGSFQQTEQIMGEELNVNCSNIVSLGKELLQCICSSRSWLEDIMSEIMEKHFALFVLYQCHIGAFIQQIMHLNVDSGSIQYTHDESCSVLVTLESTCMEILDESMACKGLKDKDVIQNHRMLNLSCLGETVEVQSGFQTVQHASVGPIVTTQISNSERPEFSSDQNCSLERVVKLEKDNFELTHDMRLVKEAICNLAIYSDSFMQELNSHEEVSESAYFPVGKEKSGSSVAAQSIQTDIAVSSCASFSDFCKDIGIHSEIIHDNTVVVLESETIHEDSTRGVITNLEVLFTDIQHLKSQFTQLTTLHLAVKDHSQFPLWQTDNREESSFSKHSVKSEYVHQGETGMLNYSNTKTEYGGQSIKALNKLWNNLQCLIDTFHPWLHVDTKNRLNKSLLDRVFQGICSIEDKTYLLLERCTRNTMKQADVLTANSLLEGELAQKDDLVKGLLSNVESIRDENDMAATLSQVQHELAIKIAQVDNILMEQKMLEAKLEGTEAALSSSRSEIEQAQKNLVTISNENTELRRMLDDAYVERIRAEELLEDKKVIESLGREILSINSSVEGKFLTSIDDVMDELRRVSNERDHLRTEIVYMNDKLEMASALADENEAIAVEARQVAEASKIYAEDKEEEVKILERSVEVLEYTIDILEEKVRDMKEEVESYQLIRKGLELEVHALTQRMLTVENAAEVLVAEDSNVEGGKSQIPRRLDDRIIELFEARKHIEDLEMEKTYKAEEIKQYREHISELVLHSEAQSSLYQEKFKALESMVSEVKPDPSISNPAGPIANKTEKISARTRGSGSPFRCIASLVQQMNSEKDQELSLARLRIEELEALAANRQKEVCVLTARLAAVDSMTHDVIRDLLGVKLDMTNYANLIDREQLQKLLKEAQEQIEESNDKEKDILDLKEQINHLIEERDSLVEEINQRKADMLASQLTVERLKQRDQLLTAQNELLKIDKANNHRKIAELDEKVRLLMGPRTIHDQIQKPIKIKENNSQRVGSEELSRRLAHSDKLLSHARN